MAVDTVRRKRRYAPWREALLDQWEVALGRLAAHDAVAVEWAAERERLRQDADQLHDGLWPPANILWRGRRPPLPGRAPLAPMVHRPVAVRGGRLRLLALAILERHGALALPDIHSYIHLYGYEIGGGDVVKHLADCLRYEVTLRRARRVERGVYECIAQPPRRTWWDHSPILAPVDPHLLSSPSNWDRQPRPLRTRPHDPHDQRAPSYEKANRLTGQTQATSNQSIPFSQ
jgi:hypothetical protein